MTPLQLTADSLHPLWVSSLKTGQGYETEVQGDGRTVEVNGGELLLKYRREPAEKLVVWKTHSGFFRALTVPDWKEFLAAQEEQEVDRQRHEDARKALEAQRRHREALEAQRVNSALGIPVAWDVTVKDTKSGLAEHSQGHGHQANTVYHVQLLEELNEGRLQRGAGWLLCSANSKANGLFQLAKPARIEGPGGPGDEEIAPAVTCKECLRVAERWAKNLA